MRPQYVKLKPVDGDDIEGESLDVESKQSGTKLESIFTGLILAACFVAGGLGGWFGRDFYEPPRFSEAQEALISKGYTNAAEHLGEIDQVCPNKLHAPIACGLLLGDSGEISHKDDPSEVSYANPHH